MNRPITPSESEKDLLEVYADKALEGPGFIIYAPKEKPALKAKIMEYFSVIVLEELSERLEENELAEFGKFFESTSEEEVLQKIALKAAEVPDFNVHIEEKLEEESDRIGLTGRIPELS